MCKHVLCAVQVKLLRAEPCDAFLMDVGSQGMEAGHGNIDPQVKLIPTNQQRVLNVVLYNCIAIVHELGQILEDEDASAPGQICWFADPKWGPPFGLLSKRPIRFDILCVIIWQIERQRAEVKNICSMNTPHTLKVSGQGIFLGDECGFRIMVEALPWVNHVIVRSSESGGAPPQVPVIVILRLLFKLQPASFQKHLSQKLRA